MFSALAGGLLQLLSPHLAADDGRLNPAVVKPYVVRRLKDDVARGDPPRPISRRHPPQPIVVAPTAREKEIHQRLRGHSRRMLRALRGTDSYHVQAFALEVLRKRALSSPACADAPTPRCVARHYRCRRAGQPYTRRRSAICVIGSRMTKSKAW